MNAGRLLLGDVLGEGAFGMVLKAEAQDIANDKNVKTTVAVKTIKGWPICLSAAFHHADNYYFVYYLNVLRYSYYIVKLHCVQEGETKYFLRCLLKM